LYKTLNFVAHLSLNPYAVSFFLNLSKNVFVVLPK